MAEHADELCITRDGQRFAFACPPGGEAALLAEVVPLVNDASHPLTWFDAALLCHQLRERFSVRIADVEADRSR